MTQIIGRPRDETLEHRILDATEAILLEGGYAKLTIDGIVSRAGTSRPAFYRRFTGVPALLLAMLFRKFGETPRVDTGTLQGDLLAIQREQARVFNNPLVRRCLLGFLDSLLTDEELTETFVSGFFGPRRAATQEAIVRGIARGEAADASDLDWVCDLLSGPLMMRATFPHMGPIDDSVVTGTVRAALVELQLPAAG
ncbi:TetR/AcrR family transcriptional regulator [Microbacterium sp. USTB-Y]|uniref:TetR/AcrR family transcriptional regulator n=1 Tax=Microbacterium sp. USTB-Y TaxID=2823692 RepID=UPI00203A397D|nr:TetR/AcrR family transcriptional regulator [Microbacterium sp. USTB-Y]